MTVVVIIGIFAVIALPAVAGQLRERRSANAAHEVAQLYRGARMRALGRGSAVLVRYTTGAGFEVREAVTGNAAFTNQCALSVISSCLNQQARWENNTDSTSLDTFDPVRHSGNEAMQLQVLDANNGDMSALDICFAPSGATFERAGSGGTFARMLFVPKVKVWTNDGSGSSGVNRVVYVLPGGMARVGI